MTAPAAGAHAEHPPTTAFQAEMIASGTDPEVAAELERRIAVIEQDEATDESRKPLSGAELALYVGVSVVAVAIGALVVAL